MRTMRKSVPCAMTVLASLAAATPAFSQARYLCLSGDILGDLETHAILKEVRQGTKVVSAELDVCHSIPDSSSRKDRFVIALQPDGTKLSGKGTSQEAKMPVSASLSRKSTKDGITYEGTITRSSATTKVSSPDNVDMSEADFRDSLPSDDIKPLPADFTSVLPKSVAVRFKREALADVARNLKEQNIRIAYAGLLQDCDTLRSGQQTVFLDVDPERAAAVVAKLTSVPSVTAAGWIGGDYGMNNAVLFPAASWRDPGGKLDRQKMASRMAEVAAKSFAAKLDSSSWDEATGELTLKLKRPDAALPGLNLTKIIEVMASIGPEKIGSNANFIVWVSDPVFDTVDEGPAPRLVFRTTQGGDDAPPPPESEKFVRTLAEALGGRLWDGQNEKWK